MPSFHVLPQYVPFSSRQSQLLITQRPPTHQPRHYPDHYASFQPINGQYYSKGERGDYYNVANSGGIPSYAITPQNADSFPTNRGGLQRWGLLENVCCNCTD